MNFPLRTILLPVISMMTSQILKVVDFTKIQKSRYLGSDTSFFLQVKKIIRS